jgi:uncharacterized protein YggU (UPF0235/DUF167 family)
LEDPDLREVALGGADTTTRTKTVWQLKSWPVEQDMTEPSKPVNLTTQKGKNARSTIEKRVLYQLETKNQALEKFEVWKKNSLSTGTLQVQVKPQVDANRCSPSPEAGYSGDENRLYRVEIHPGITGKSKAPLFKWSRENASVAARIINVKAGQKTTEKLLVIRNTGKDDRTRFGEGQWIELTDDYHELWNLPGRIVKIISAEEDTLENVYTLKVSDVGLDANDNESLLHFNLPDSSAQKDTYIPLNPKVRRWNIPDDKWSILGYSADPSAAESQQKPILTGTTSTFTDLEDNIQIKFSVNNYVPGDYWLIPARTITKSLECQSRTKTALRHPKRCRPSSSTTIALLL